MWIVASSLAGELPWECPAVTTPAEAKPHAHSAGVPELIDALEVEARTWWDEGCDWTITETSAYPTDVTTQTCATAAGAEVSYSVSTTSWSYGNGTEAVDAWTLTVRPPPEASYTSLTVTSSEGSVDDRYFVSTETTSAAEWTGAIEGYPDGGHVRYTRSTGESGWYDGNFTQEQAFAVETSGCDWSWDRSSGSFLDVQHLTLGDHTITFADAIEETCDYLGHRYARFDGDLYGAVDPDTWELVEVDRDGWTAADGDCDDLDPAVYPCAEEVAHDGVDQDCDGADDLDADEGADQDSGDADLPGDAEPPDTGSAVEGEEDAPEDAGGEAGRGCAGGGGAWLVAPLVLRSRRRRAP